MRDPWFPVALILIVLLGAWLGIFGPLPNGVAGWLNDWQTLLAAFVAATIASIAAYIAFQNTSRSLAHNEELERRRRGRKHAALRAMLPLALATVTDYAERSAHALEGLLEKCEDELLPEGSASENLAQPLPAEALSTLADFIEYSDAIDISALEATVACVQIHHSRVYGLIKGNRDASETQIILKINIEHSIIDAATIYAGISLIFDYARRRSDDVPHTVSWNDVIKALRNMRFWDEEYPHLYDTIARQQGISGGPFDRKFTNPPSRPA